MNRWNLFIIFSFSVLNLPSNVNLLHASATSAGSRTSFATQQRKDMAFTLNIYDKSANERHSLKYNGRKSISDIKRDVYSLTLIPDHRQIWTGWPTNFGERVLFSRFGSYFELEVFACVSDIKTRAENINIFIFWFLKWLREKFQARNDRVQNLV